MQCGLGIGFFLASFVWLFVSPLGPGAWRYMYLIGVLPALFTFWVRRGIPESVLWEAANERRRSAQERQRTGATLDAQEHALTRFTVVELFAEPEIRRRTIIAFLMSLTTTLAWWGISSWVPPYIASVAAKAGLPAQQWASFAGMAYNLGAIIGYISLGFLADAFGRKPIALLFFAAALVMTPVLFLWTSDLNLLLVVVCINGVLQPRAIFLDAGVAAGAVPDADARHRHRLLLQRAALHRLHRSADRRHADRELRRFRQCRDHGRDDLYPRPRHRAVPAGDQRQAVAGNRLSAAGRRR